MLVTKEATLLTLRKEIEGVASWCTRKSITYEWEPDELRIKTTFIQKVTGEKFFLVGEFFEYPLLPPSWYFSDEKWEAKKNKSFYPSATKTDFGSSIFHKSKVVICAPFNRLAFAQEGGPHSNWGDLTNWKNIPGNMIRALTVPDMLSAIYRDFSYSEGRM